MHIGRNYTLKEVAFWTHRETLGFFATSTLPLVLHLGLGWKGLVLPWPPIALIGTVVAFVTGFKNNASYGRLWEARQLWGGIVNTSRTLGIQVMSFLAASLTDTERHTIQQRLLYRHIAWLTLLRYQLRKPAPWEQVTRAENQGYLRFYSVPEWQEELEPQLCALLSDEERAAVQAVHNPAIALLGCQSQELTRLLHQGLLTERCYLELERGVASLVDLQGKCERIKNFPYPRQFATLNLIFIWLFIVLVPFGLYQEFERVRPSLVWLTVPISTLIAWVIHTMDKIGSSSENPFEGNANDVPITALSRTIEIDLRELLGEKSVPEPRPPQGKILM